MLFSRNPGTFKQGDRMYAERKIGTFNPGDKLYAEGAKKKPTLFNDYQNDDSTMHFSQESQYDAGPAMPRSVSAGSARPEYQDDPMTEPEMTKPSLFGGMDRPERAKPKWYDYVLSFLLPALQGGLSGQGALSGLVSGASNMLSNKFQNQAKDEANWEKDREFGQKERALTADKDLARAKLGVDLEDKKFDRKLKLEELGLKKNPPARPRMQGPYDPVPEEQRAYESLSPEEVNHLTNSNPDQLMKYMAAPDPEMRRAATHIWKLQRAGKQLSNPMDQFMMDQMNQGNGT